MRDGLLIVTDVDNTLFDWVAIWSGAFDAMVDRLTSTSGTPRDEWLAAVHRAHVRRQATECPSLLCDLASSMEMLSDAGARRVLREAAATYRTFWEHHLVPYGGVLDTLSELARSGHQVVAYTEGDAVVAAGRLARLGLSGIVRRVFGRAPLPAAQEPSWSLVDVSRSCPIAVDFVPREDAKPSPAGLARIIARCGRVPRDVVYVGDNLWKDVAMARALGAAACWARYGTSRDPAHAALLNRVAHWTAVDLGDERRATPHGISPDAILDDPRALVEAVALRGAMVSSI